MRVDWLITLPTPVFLVLPLTASTRMGKRNPTPDQLQQLAHVDRLEEARCHAERRDLMLHFLGARRDDDWNRVFHLPDPKAVHERKLQIEQDETRWCGALQPIDCLLTIGGGKELVGLPPAGSASAWCGSRGRLDQQDGFARREGRHETSHPACSTSRVRCNPEGQGIGGRKWMSRTREDRTIGLVPLGSGRVRSDSPGGTRGASTLRGRRRLVGSARPVLTAPDGLLR